MAGSQVVVTPSLVFASSAGQIIYDYNYYVGGNSRMTQGYLVYLTDDYQWRRLSIPDVYDGGLNPYSYGAAPTQMRGFALNAAYDGQPLSVLIVDTDFDCGGTLGKGTTYVAGGGLGRYETTSDLVDQARVTVGVAKSTSKLVVNLSATGQGA